LDQTEYPLSPETMKCAFFLLLHGFSDCRGGRVFLAGSLWELDPVAALLLDEEAGSLELDAIGGSRLVGSPEVKLIDVYVGRWGSMI
jgi:hypothetical protein